MLGEHYWDTYLFFGMACILVVYLAAYFIILVFGELKQRKTRLTHADEMYHVKGDSARSNVRRA